MNIQTYKEKAKRTLPDLGLNKDQNLRIHIEEIGEKLNLSDTSAMLSKRIGRDTISLSNRINIKLDSAQIPGIIAPYLQSVSGMKYSDTAAMLTSRFARDTASLSNRINTRN